MTCEGCDRNNLLKAYCYFSNRPELFKFITGNDFNVISFATFATEMQLSMKTSFTCYRTVRMDSKVLWAALEEAMIKALREYNLSKG